ncbi:hypothetical protein KQH82_03065 [bacterium]|nr:hypothetical protein [bacterium]
MKVRLFGAFMVVLYLAGLSALAYGAWYGMDYYRMPTVERPHANQHEVLKPGGLIGHGFGMVGSSMILLLFLYSARKRGKFGLRFGRMNRWLDVHIWFGIMGPLFITLHTAGKFGGIVSISYWSMMAVMLSGFIGRYIYMQIPRDDSGHALSLAEIENTIDGLSNLLERDYDVTPEVVQSLSRRALGSGFEGTGAFGVILAMLLFDLSRPFRNWRLRRYVRRLYPNIPSKATAEILQAAKSRAALTRRRAVLKVINSVFHYWHVIHKPFAIVMIVIMFVHIAVVTLMGYKWIF